METGSVTEAAAKIMRTQPQVSRLIMELEAELQFRLFTRDRQRLRPTSEGDSFYREAERILVGFDQIADVADAIRRQKSHRLRIVAENHLSQTLIPVALKEFSKKWPDTYISIEVQSRREVPNWVMGNQFDLGLMVGPINHPAIRQFSFAAARLVVVSPKGGSLTGKKKVALSQLKGERLVLLKPLLMLRERVDEALREAGIKPNVCAEVSTGLAACQLVARNLGITITDPFTAALMNKASVEIHDLEPKMEIYYAFLFPELAMTSELIEAFLEYVVDAAQMIGRHRVRVLDRAGKGASK